MKRERIKKRGRPPIHQVKNFALKRAVDIVGGTTNLALDIGVHPNKISDWLYKDQKIPAHHVPKIVKATGGEIKPEELRPDVFVSNVCTE